MTAKPTRGGAAPAPVVAADGWEQWLHGYLDVERNLTNEVTGEVVAALRVEIVDAVEKRIGPLQREVAELAGAMGVLKGLGPPPGIRFRGNYDPNVDYSIHDIVAKNGSSFVALRDRPGACPGKHWQLVASKGNRGERGGPGPRGMTGGRGEPAPGIKGWLVNKAKLISRETGITLDGSAGCR